MSLTEIQKNIVEAPLGPLLVTAGAGSGKTRVLTHRIAWIIKNLGIQGSEIVALTFTNKAAKEMNMRATDLLGYPCDVFLGTFHSFCTRFLRKNIIKLGSPYTGDFSIYNTSDTHKVIKEVLSNSSFSELDKDDVKKVEWYLSNMKNGGETFDYSEDVLRAIGAYNEKLKSNNALDFDDLLLKTIEIFESCPEVLDAMQRRFKYVLVDEFQDTNKIQYRIAKLLADKHKNIMVVGDEDQCIYSWRGASIENINSLRKDFPGIEIRKLEENFRSSKNIVELANKLVECNNNRIGKVLFSNRKNGVINFRQCFIDKDEARDTAEMIVSSVRSGMARYSDFAILMRINALSRIFEEQFLAYNIPHIIWGGFKFYERTEVKRTLNYLRVLVNSRDDVALLDIINWPRRGVGDASVEKIRELSYNQSCYETIMHIDKFADNFTKKTLAGIKSFADTLQNLNEMNDSFGLFELAGSLISTIGLDKVLTQDAKKKDEEARLENLYQLEKAIKDFTCDNPDATLGQYLQSVSLASGDDMTSGDDVVTISTVHSAKGLEFKTVFIVGLEDGLFPLARSKNSEAEMEEERRLLYVAITRAREKLYLTCCAMRYLHGERKMCLPSSFLRECGFETKRSFNPDFGCFGGGTEDNFFSYTSTKLKNTEPEITSKPDTVESLGFAVGDRVHHEKFGDGTVIDIIDKNIIKIKFEVVGMKMLSLAFATITKRD